MPTPQILITAGPTHEPIDAVRFIGNRSSGRLGVALADEAARRGWSVTLLLGPVCIAPAEAGVRVAGFRTADDLDALLIEHVPTCDVLIMAAAVADYRPRRTVSPDGSSSHTGTGKIKRGDQSLILELEPTTDLLAKAAAARRPGQFFVGFALEPRDRLRVSALAKLERKNLDMVVANPLETMDAPSIEATVFARGGTSLHTNGAVEKSEFAGWLLDVVQSSLRR